MLVLNLSEKGLKFLKTDLKLCFEWSDMKFDILFTTVRTLHTVQCRRTRNLADLDRPEDKSKTTRSIVIPLLRRQPE